MSEPKTVDRLDAIRVRASEHAACATCTTTEAILQHDVPALIAEVERLRAAIRDHRSGLEIWTQDMYGRWQLVREEDARLWRVLDDGGPSEVEERFWKRVGEYARGAE